MHTLKHQRAKYSRKCVIIVSTPYYLKKGKHFDILYYLVLNSFISLKRETILEEKKMFSKNKLHIQSDQNEICYSNLINIAL